MKKFFLIPLMAMLCTVMAMATVRTAGTFAELQSAISAAANGDEIKLTADIAYPKNGTDLINITKSITLDGQGHKISGYGDRGGQPNVISINYNNSSYVTVELKNLDIYSTQYRPLETRGYLTKLTLDNVNITSTGGSSNPQGLTIGGTQTDEPYAQLIIKDSKISVGTSGYPVIFWNPTMVTAENSYFNGYCGLYFKSGSAQTVVDADNCNFDAPNVHAYADGWNNFGVFTMEDGNITLNLHNCGMNAQETGLANQGMLLPEASGCEINISGDNSHINGHMVLEDSSYPGYWLAFLWITADFSISGGTYSVDPSHVGPFNPYTWFGSQVPTLPNEDMYANFVPDGYEVQEVKQGNVTLYRVAKKAASYIDPETEKVTLYDLNDAVETTTEGENPVTSFELSTGGTMELDKEREVTTAGYVQVKDNEDTDKGTVIKVGTTDNEENKVDQTLVINNGLDVQGKSKVEVQSGSTLQIGEGGINTESSDNIVIEADEDGAGSLLLDPTITINQTPDLTVKMLAKQIGRDASGDFFWHRFAMPVLHIENWDKEGTLEGKGSYVVTYPTYVYAWDYDENDWKNIAPKAMIPLKGYTLTLASDYIHMDGDKVESEGTDGGNLNVLQDVYYTFKGNLVGNTDQALKFEKEGFNFFGNSYTGYMDALTVINGIESEHVDNTIYMWNSAEQTYSAVGKYKLENEKQRKRLADWQKEIAPMQTFILRLRGADDADESVSYADAIWGNPRYGNSTPAPARLASADEEDAYLEIKVTAANGKSDKVDFTEMASKSDAFESAYDAEKYINRNSLNLYADVEGINLSSVVTDDLIGKTLSMQTVNEVNYTMTFANVEGNEYALLDKATNEVIAITNDAVYTFSAQPNSTVENRFEIVAIAKAPTAVENTESSVKARGIYTMLGQYMGEDITVLPAGVYVVNGVKIVK